MHVCISMSSEHESSPPPSSSWDSLTAREHFLHAAPEGLRDEFAIDDRLQTKLDRLLADARESWPNFDIDDGTFLRYVAERLGERDDALSGLLAGDLYLACACSRGDEPAISSFRSTYLQKIRFALRSLPRESVDDLAQSVMVKLFVSSERRPPVISKYAGRGKLGSWVQTIAVREGQSLLRKEAGLASDEIEMLVDKAFDVVDAEMLELKTRYHEALKRAFEHGFNELALRERNLLRHEYLDGLDVDRIAALYGTSCSIAHSWRSQAHSALFDQMKKVVTDDLSLDGDDFNRVLRLIESQHELILARITDGEGDASPSH